MRKAAVRLPVTDNDKGVALLHIVMVLIFIGAIIGIAALVSGPLSKRVKVSETRGIVNAGMGSLTGYAATNRRLPTTVQFSTVVQKASDAWRNPLYYIVDANLAPAFPTASTDYICGRSSTPITVRSCGNASCSVYTDTLDVAFMIGSPGANFNNQTAATQSVASATRFNVYDAGLSVDGYAGDLGGVRAEPYDDVVRWVTLEELKNRVGCYGSTKGRFRILNNELPTACIGQSYSAELFSDGGVVPYNNWTWTAPVLPAGLSMDFITGKISGIPTGPAQIHNVTFSRSDSGGNTAQKVLRLIVAGCPLKSWNFDDPASLGGAVTGTGSVTSAAGMYGSAVFFNGISTFTPYNQGVDNSRYSFEYNQPFSIVLWVKLTKFPTTAPVSTVYPFVSKAGLSPDYNGYYLELHGSNYPPPPNTAYHRVVFRLVGRESSPPRFIYVYNTTPVDTLDAWYHVAVSYNGSGLASGARLYVNGGPATLVSKDNLSSLSIVNTQPLRVGDYGKNYYNSVVMDEIQIYDTTVQQLKVTRAGSGAGAVVSPMINVTQERINCGTVCEAYYMTGTIVTLYASASPGNTFAGWSGGGCSGTGTCTVTLGSDADVTATFTNP